MKEFFTALAGNPMVPLSIIILVAFYLFKDAILAAISAKVGAIFLDGRCGVG